MPCSKACRDDAATKLLMNFEVTPTSHRLADYRARGGYATLEKVLREMRPEEVTKEVAASGILGHGGAAFPAGRKWGVIRLNDGLPHYLCANADEGEPGTFKDRWILEHAPHLLIESMLIAAYALQVRHAFVYIRGEFDLPVPAHRRGGRGSLRRRLARRAASPAAPSRSTSSSTAAPARTSAARRRAC